MTEIEYDNGNSKLENLDNESEDEMVRGGDFKPQQTQLRKLDSQTSEGSYMVRFGAQEEQSEGSYMVKQDSKLPPGFDDQSSQGFIRKVNIDDMESQGSYLKRKKNVNGFDDMQSQGSYMVRGYNGPADGQQLFNADDDDQSDIELERGSLYSSQITTGNIEGGTRKDGIKQI